MSRILAFESVFRAMSFTKLRPVTRASKTMALATFRNIGRRNRNNQPKNSHFRNRVEKTVGGRKLFLHYDPQRETPDEI